MIEEWQRVAVELAIRIETHVVIEIKDKCKIECPVLVKDFGHFNGMVLVVIANNFFCSSINFFISLNPSLVITLVALLFASSLTGRAGSGL
jgi:hypothetical protein